MTDTQKQIIELYRCLDSNGKQQFHYLLQAMAEMNRSEAKKAEKAGQKAAARSAAERKANI